MSQNGYVFDDVFPADPKGPPAAPTPDPNKAHANPE